jgi:hypothetical protein
MSAIFTAKIWPVTVSCALKTQPCEPEPILCPRLQVPNVPVATKFRSLVVHWSGEQLGREAGVVASHDLIDEGHGLHPPICGVLLTFELRKAASGTAGIVKIL